MLEAMCLGVQNLGQRVRRLPARSLVGLVVLLTCFVGLASAWHLTAAEEWFAVERIVAFGKTYRGSPVAPLLVLAAFIAGSFLVMPLTVLVAATAVLFGPAWGFLYAFAGALISAMILFAVGRVLGRDAARRLAGRRLGEVSRRLAHHGLPTMIIVRMVPIAPFTVVNLAAGVSEVRTRDFVLGSIVGMAPGIAAFAVLGDRLEKVLEQPDPANLALLALLGLALLFGGALLSRWTTRQAARLRWGEDPS